MTKEQTKPALISSSLADLSTPIRPTRLLIHSRALRWANERRAPLACSALFILSAFAYFFFWGPVVEHRNVWIPPGDIWGTIHAAHYVAWGDLGQVYTAGTGLVTFPGILIVIAPLASLSSALGLAESFPFFLPRTTSWLLYGPFLYALACSALFALDSLARKLGVPASRRTALCLLESVLLWPSQVLWGHPEDALAVALAVWGLIAAMDRRLVATSWLYGLSIAVQPLTLLLAPLAFGMFAKRCWPGMLARAALIPGFLVGTCLLAAPKSTWRALVLQPNYFKVDHPTPLMAIAPRLSSQAVSAGPGRMLAVMAAMAIGLWLVPRAKQRASDAAWLVWLGALMLALRPLLESVMDPFYVWPALALGVVLAATMGTWRWLSAWAAAIFTTVCTFWHLASWPYWLLLAAGLGALLLGVLPRQNLPGKGIAATIRRAPILGAAALYSHHGPVVPLAGKAPPRARSSPGALPGRYVNTPSRG
ncbi:MAG: hypothetical protein M1115_05600 [Actinobacteria bacterium]|nr:hypothetical protein [Actinomycetota bacterium]